jgi:Fe-S-cluster containining protein
MLKDKKIMVFKWFMDHDDCPFLVDNSCAIYENRPSICRSFPCLAPFAMQKFDKPIFSKYCPFIEDGINYESLIVNYNYFIKKQDDLLQKINSLIKEGLVLNVKTSTIMRLSNNPENLSDFS